jgi:hypothetical protein
MERVGLARAGDAAVSRLSRLSVRAYGRLTPERRLAVDRLRHGHLTPAGAPGAAERGELKTILRWRRTAEETVAYARTLIDGGLDRDAAAIRLRIDADYLRRLLEKVPDVENRPRNPSIHPEKTGLTDNGKAAGRPSRSGLSDNGSRAPDPHPDSGRIMYDGDPGSYDFEAALRRSSR